MHPANTLITPVVDRDDGGDLSGWAGPQKGHPTCTAGLPSVALTLSW